MVSNGLHDTGEEWTQKTTYRQDLLPNARDTEVQIGLVDDATAGLTDASDVGDIGTDEPSGSYARQPVNLDSGSMAVDADANNNVRVSFSVSYDVSTADKTIDSWFGVVEFESNMFGNSETGTNPHLLTSVALDGGSKDLSQNDTVNLDGSITLD